jgi:hypothetical protein
LPARINQQPPYDPANAMSGGYPTGVGNETNIGVDQSIYSDILKQIQEADMKTEAEIHKAILQIEELCAANYILPQTLPRYLSIVNYVMDSLAEFRSLTDDAKTNTEYFMDDIMSIG